MRPVCWLVIAGMLAPAAWARADEFHLANGGRVSGRLLNPDELPRKQYVIALDGGGQVTLDRAQVRQHVRPLPAETEYETVRHTYPDTVEGHWQLAEWCRAKGLTARRNTHLERIVELDPEHAEARRLLGYQRVDGEWKTQDQVMTDRGYVKYRGRWRLPQEIDVEERRREQELQEKAWFANLSRWREWLDSPGRRAEALEKLEAINDPYAVPALKHRLAEEPVPEVRQLYLMALARINTGPAVETLAQRALLDPVEELRLTCLDMLDNQVRPDVVRYFIGELGNNDNAVVNRAAIGLARMKDPSAVGPLIDALVTTHKQQVGSANPNQMTFSFSPQTGGGFGTGGSAKVLVQQVRNLAVLDALVMLTGVNYSYDVPLWKRWYAAQRQQDAPAAGRN